MHADVFADPRLPFSLLALLLIALAAAEFRHRRSLVRKSADRLPGAPPRDAAPSRNALLILGGAWAVLIAAAYVRLVWPSIASLPRIVQGDGVLQFLSFQLAVFCVTAAVSWFAVPRFSAAISACVLGLSTVVFLAAMRGPSLVAFLLFAVWAIGAAGTVRWGIRRFVRPDFADWGTSAAALGAIGVHLAFAIGLVRLMTPAVVGALALAIAAPGLVRIAMWCARRPNVPVYRLLALSPAGQAAMEAVWLMLAATFVVASGPETAFDSASRYLPHIRGIAAHGGLYMQYIDVLWYRPEAVQTWMATAFVLGSTGMAKWLSWSALFGIVLLMAGEVSRRTGRFDAGVVAAAFTLSCPLLLWLSTTLYIDHVAVLLCSGAFFLLVRALETDSRRALVLSALLMGAAAQSRQNLMISAVIWLCIVAWDAVRTRRPGALSRWVIPAALALGIACLPWYAYTWATTGNPVFPYLNKLFASPLWPDLEPMSTLTAFGAGDRWWSHALLPWTAVFHTSRFVEARDGALGFALLAALPFMLASPFRRGRGVAYLFVAGATSVVATCLVTEYARYWMHGIPPLIAAAVVALPWQADAIRPRALAGPALAALPMLAALLAPLPLWNPSFTFGDYFLGRTPLETMLDRHVRGYPVVKEINRIAGAEEATICTEFPYVGLFHGPAYEMPLWKLSSRLVPSVRDSRTFDAFLERAHIRFWVLHRPSLGEVGFIAHPLRWWNEIVQAERYWSDDRLIWGSGTMTAYWAGPLPETRTLRPMNRFDEATAAWRATVSTAPARGPALAPPTDADLCRVTFGAGSSGNGRKSVVVAVDCADASGRPLSGTEAPCEVSGKDSRFTAAAWFRIPAGTRTVMPTFRSPRGVPLELDELRVEFFDAP